MDRLKELQTLLTQYVDTVDDLMRRRRPGEGILGMGGGPQDHPCHEQFDQQAEAIVRQALADGPSPDAAAALVRCLLEDESAGHGVQCAQLMLAAIQRHALPLIPLLSPADARQLLQAYAARYPLFKRFPAQTEVIKALKKQIR